MTSCDMIHIPFFMKTGTGVQAILSFFHRNLGAEMLVLLIRRIYGLRHWNGLRCFDTKFYKDLFSHSKVNRAYTHADTHTHTHTQTHREQDDLISLLFLFQNKERRLKILFYTPDNPCLVRYAYNERICLSVSAGTSDGELLTYFDKIW
jgi:hypothetical protein